MKTKLIERAFHDLGKTGFEGAKKGQQNVALTYRDQEPFTGFENYKKKLVQVTDASPALGWVLCHYDNTRIIPVDRQSKERRENAKKIRYALYRWRTQARVDAMIAGQKSRHEIERKRNKADKLSLDIIKQFELNLVVQHNGGAFGFAIKWDIDPVDPSKCYVRGSSVEKQWHENLDAKELSHANV